MISQNNTLENHRKEGRLDIVTFHPSFSYEEFIEGLTVDLDNDKAGGDSVSYCRKPGLFKEACKRALGSAIKIDHDELQDLTWKDVYERYCKTKDQVKFKDAPKHVLIIDEINRGDIAKIFGELITLVEKDKRIGEKNQVILTLPSSGDQFGVSPNLYVIGTMNTADRSIALLDVALRRRFGFVEMNPDFDILESEFLDKEKTELEKNGVYEMLKKSVAALERVNERISEDPAIGRDRQIGHSFLFNISNMDELALVWKYEILPLLEEYCYSDYKKINELLFLKKDSDSPWISQRKGIGEINSDNLEDMLVQIIKEKKTEQDE